MNDTMLEKYTERLDWLHAVAPYLGSQYPQLAPQLVAPTPGAVDPHVERLIEGIAYLATRVDVKLDAQEVRVAHDLLASVVPCCEKPIPSAAVVRIELDPNADLSAGGVCIDRDTKLQATVEGIDQRCTYRVIDDTHLLPIRVVASRYIAVGSRAGRLEIHLEPSHGQEWNAIASAATCPLVLTLTNGGESMWKLYDLLTGPGARISAGTKAAGPAQGLKAKPLGFESASPMFDMDRLGVDSDRTVQEYLAFPERFAAVAIEGWQAAARGSERSFVLRFDVDAFDERLSRSLEDDAVATNCAVCVNLFAKRVDPILHSDQIHEYQVQPDRAHPQDFEVHTVRSVSAMTQDLDSIEVDSVFADVVRHAKRLPGFVLRRAGRVRSEAEQRRGSRTSYTGSDVFLTWVDAPEYDESNTPCTLSIRAMVTNRDLPLLISRRTSDSDLATDGIDGVSSIKFVHGPTPPRPPRILTTTAVAASTMIAAARTPVSSDVGRQVLRTRWRSLAPYGLRQAESLIDGISRVSVSQATRVAGSGSRTAMVPGSRVSVDLDPVAFEGTSVPLFARVMSASVQDCAPLNSFVDLRVAVGNEPSIDLPDPLARGAR